MLFSHYGLNCANMMTGEYIDDVFGISIDIDNRLDQAQVFQRLDNAIHLVKHSPADSVVNIYPLDSDLSGGKRYPAFEQQGPDLSVATAMN